MNLSTLKNDINMMNMRMNSLGSFGNPGGFMPGSFTSPVPGRKTPKEKKKKTNKKNTEKRSRELQNKIETLAADMEELDERAASGDGAVSAGQDVRAESGNGAGSMGQQARAAFGNSAGSAGLAGLRGASAHGNASGFVNLQEAVIWAEILGDPVSKKRRKRRVSWQYGNQGDADRG